MDLQKPRGEVGAPHKERGWPGPGKFLFLELPLGARENLWASNIWKRIESASKTQNLNPPCQEEAGQMQHLIDECEMLEARH